MDYNDNDALVIELSSLLTTLKAENKKLKSELESKDSLPIPKTIVRQIVEMEAVIRKQQSDIEYYKKYVPVQIIINKEQKEKPTRRGGVPK